MNLSRIRHEILKNSFQRREHINPEKHLNSILLTFSILIIPALLLSFKVIQSNGFNFHFLAELIMVSTLLITSIFRKKIKFKQKKIILAFCTFGLGFTGLLFGGENSDRWMAFILIAVYATLMYNYTVSILLLLISGLLLVLIHTLHVYGVVIPRDYFSNLGSLEIYLTLSEHLIWVGLVISIINNISSELNSHSTSKKDESLKHKETIKKLNSEINYNRALQNELFENSNRLQIAEKAINMGIVDWDFKTNIISISNQMNNILGISDHKTLKKQEFLTYIHPDTKELYIEALEKRFNTTSNENEIVFNLPIEYKIRKRIGGKLYVKEFGTLYMQNNKAVRYVGAIVDYSELTKSIKLLHHQKKYLSELVDSIHDSFIVLRGVNMIDDVFQDLVLLNANQKFLDALKLNYDDVFERPIRSFLPNIEKIFYQRCSEVILRGNSIVEEIYSKSLNRYLKVSFHKIRFKTIFLVIEDITDEVLVQNRIVNSIIQAEEKERSRISKELHDGVGPLLSTLKMLTEKFISTKNTETRNKIEPRLSVIIDETISNISSISNNLTPKLLETFGIKKSIYRFIKHAESATSCKFDYQMNSEERFNENIEITIYRVITELINNSLKYSHPSEIKLFIEVQEEIIFINFSDNGIGFNFKEKIKEQSGQGLYNLKSRIESLQGKLEYLGEDGKGVKYQIEVPI